MNNTKEKTEIQQFTVDEVMAALMCIEDKDAKNTIINKLNIAQLTYYLNHKDVFDEAIKELENGLCIYENLINGLYLMLDILQVSNDIKG